MNDDTIPTRIDDTGARRAFSPVCMTCRHLAIGTRAGLSNLVCAAFPQGVPEAIWSGRHDHRTEYPGDGGVRWEAQRGEQDR